MDVLDFLGAAVLIGMLLAVILADRKTGLFIACALLVLGLGIFTGVSSKRGFLAAVKAQDDRFSASSADPAPLGASQP
jgi:hypothetical protein